jgi:hypothetical protein
MQVPEPFNAKLSPSMRSPGHAQTQRRGNPVAPFTGGKQNLAAGRPCGDCVDRSLNRSSAVRLSVGDRTKAPDADPSLVLCGAWHAHGQQDSDNGDKKASHGAFGGWRFDTRSHPPAPARNRTR